MRVAQGILEGMTYAEIAKHLGVAERTVKGYTITLAHMLGIDTKRLLPKIAVAVRFHELCPEYCPTCNPACSIRLAAVRKRLSPEQCGKLPSDAAVRKTLYSGSGRRSAEILLEPHGLSKPNGQGRREM